MLNSSTTKIVETANFYLGNNNELRHIRLQVVQSIYAHDRLAVYIKEAITGDFTRNTEFNLPTDGMKLAANVAAMLIAFISLVAMINFILGLLGTSMQEMLGLLFRPLAWTMGIPWADAKIVGTLMGEKNAQYFK